MPQLEGQTPPVVKKEGFMPQLKKRRTRKLSSHLALLGAVAIVASVLAVGTSPVTAKEGTPEAQAGYSACVGPASADAGFEDVTAGSTHDAAVNCIAYYGITVGKTEKTFAPSDNITRRQLAVMLTRAAGPADVTLGDGESVGFSDIEEIPEDVQEAINQMAGLGIMKGTTGTTFDPSGIVSRADIVEALARFLSNAKTGPGGSSVKVAPNGKVTIKTGSEDITIDETFRDLGPVTFAAHQAILAMAELGVAAGKGDGVFAPAANVTRAQAAAFITRTLDHTNIRPAGLTLQASKSAAEAGDEITLAISVRGEDFAPVDEAPIDVFKHATASTDKPFKADGTCDTSVVTTEESNTACKIDVDEETTEDDGNLMMDDVEVNGDTMFYAWTGKSSSSLDWDNDAVSKDNTVVSDAASVSITINATPDLVKVSVSGSENSATGEKTFKLGTTDKTVEYNRTVKYGTAVKVAIQLMEKEKQAKISGYTYQWRVTGYQAATTTVKSAKVLVGKLIETTAWKTITTDDDGMATFELPSTPDPDKKGDDFTTWTYEIEATGATAKKGITISNSTGTVMFDDDDPESEDGKLRLSLSQPYTRAGANSSVKLTATVTDQYGGPLKDIEVRFFSKEGEKDKESLSAKVLDTKSNGTRSLTATGPKDAGTTEYMVDADLIKGEEAASSSMTHYWVEDPKVDAADGGADALPEDAQKILVPAFANNELVVGEGSPMVFKYRIGDQFKLDGKSLSLAAFETEYGKHVEAQKKAKSDCLGDVTVTQYNTKKGLSAFEVDTSKCTKT